jgi:hypothetical protein
MVTVTKDMPEPNMKVTLSPAAKINVTVVDSDDNPRQDLWLFRLEALDGRRFIPPQRDPHLSAFASSVWIVGFSQNLWYLTLYFQGLKN